MLIALFLSASLPAQAADQSKHPVVVDDKSSFEIEEKIVELAVAEAEDEHEPIVIRTRRGAEFEFTLEPQDGYHSKSYESMPPKLRRKFQEKRILFLTKTATILDRAELAFGFGNLVRERFYFIKTFGIGPLLKKSPIDHLAESSLAPGEKPRSEIRQRGVQIISHMLSSIDRQLWEKAPILTRQNEWSVPLNITLIGIAGNKGTGLGGFLSFGFNFGYNYSDKTLAFEILGAVEKFEHAYTPTAMIGFIPKLGFISRLQKEDEDPTGLRKAKTNYIAGLPLYLYDSPEEVGMGTNTLFFAFPQFINMGMQYKTTSYTKPLIRITATSFKPRSYKLYLGLPTKLKAACSRLFTRHK